MKEQGREPAKFAFNNDEMVELLNHILLVAVAYQKKLEDLEWDIMNHAYNESLTKLNSIGLGIMDKKEQENGFRAWEKQQVMITSLSSTRLDGGKGGSGGGTRK